MEVVGITYPVDPELHATHVEEEETEESSEAVLVDARVHTGEAPLHQELRGRGKGCVPRQCHQRYLNLFQDVHEGRNLGTLQDVDEIERGVRRRYRENSTDPNQA